MIIFGGWRGELLHNLKPPLGISSRECTMAAIVSLDRLQA